MGLATVQSRAAVGIEAPQVLCEVNLSPGLPMFAIVGLPETAVRESKDRVRRALETGAGGGHNLLLIGRPGTGKTLLASRLPGIL